MSCRAAKKVDFWPAIATIAKTLNERKGKMALTATEKKALAAQLAKSGRTKLTEDQIEEMA